MTPTLIVVGVLAVVVLVIIAKTAVVVPQQYAYVVERLGKFHAVLEAGFHILLPFIDVIRYRHELKSGQSTSPSRPVLLGITSRLVLMAFCT